MRSRQNVVDLIESWVGKKESDGSFKEIIDIYNTNKNLPRGIKMQYNWAWCAATWSALAIKLLYMDIMPVEMSCGFLIDIAKKMGCWMEQDDYIPKPGDACLYDWQDSGKGDNTGWPDHIGTVTYANKESGYFIVTEGNYSNSVKKRTVSINGKFIRGFITPKYDDETATVPIGPKKDDLTIAREVIAGMWGNNPERASRLSENGYNPEIIRQLVNSILNDDAVKPSNPVQDPNQPYEKVVESTCYAREMSREYSGRYKTTDNLYLRNDAGTNKKALCIIPKGNTVVCYGFYNTSTNMPWFYVESIMDGVKYVGFCSSKYLERC